MTITIHQRCLFSVDGQDGYVSAYGPLQKIIGPLMPWVFFKQLDEEIYGSIDWKEIDWQLANVPIGSRAIINLEHPAYEIIPDCTQKYQFEVNRRAVEFRKCFIRQLELRRPDVLWAYYAFPPSKAWAEVGVEAYVEAPNAWTCGVEDLINKVHFLNPECYINSTMPLKDVLQWIKQVIDRAKKLIYADCIMPQIWPMFKDKWEKYPGNDHWPKEKWTPEIQKEILIPGDYWGAMLDQFVECGITNFMLWNESHWCPWDPKAPWWVATQKFMTPTD